MVIPGYRIHEEVVGDEFAILYRAEREGGGAPVLLKRPLASPPSAAAMAVLRREHDLLRSLQIEGVPRPLAFEAAHATLVLEDRGGTLLHQCLGKGGLAAEVVIALARRLAATLAAIHRQGIVHRSLSPFSILVDPGGLAVQVLDFGGASRLPQEPQPLRPPHRLAGRIAYISPEQTGRMNRVVGYRTDLYSLGVTLYHALTGSPPFRSEDPLELVHGHIAVIPFAPSEVDPKVPRPLSAIVMKLLAKTAEDRYQSASGLQADLELCDERHARGVLFDFPLGGRDVSDRFTIPQRLYGREEETETLLSAFERAGPGRARLMLVSGYSGVGKTSLVQEVHKPIVRQRGRFLAGKFEQLDRNVPYGAIVQAFRGFVQQVLGESDQAIAALRERLLETLGANAGVMTAVIPELTRLIGPQAPGPQLGPAESQNRFNYVFQDFLGVFARPEQPLVIFLDDLQWADAATLQLIGVLLTSPVVRHLFVIGAYRDNEVSPDHALIKALEEMRAAGAAVEEIALAPLRLPHLVAFISDALGGGAAAAEPLARLVLRKTAGNPFFVTQFLKSLHHDGLLVFDHEAGHWAFDLDRIEQAQITDNVVDLMTKKLRRLSEPARQAITLAACIGNSFSLSTLAVVRESTRRQAASELWEAIEGGLIIPTTDRYELLSSAPEDVLETTGPSYRFLHDRVQQAAYALIPEDQRKPVHLRVGRLLLSGCGGTVPDERLFEVVNHLNIGQELIPSPEEQRDLVLMNLAAGRKAKASAAFRAALDYLRAGLRLLPEGCWQTDHETSLALTMEAAECEYLCGRFAEAERSFETLLAEARSPLQKAEAHRMRIVQYESMARYADSVRVGREGLTLLRVRLPEDETEKRAALDHELAGIQAALGGRAIGSLENLPTMVDPETKMIVTLLTAMWAPAYILGDSTLAFLFSARMVSLSMEHGNTEDSAYGYVTHAIAVGPVRGDYRSAYEWGALALRVNDRFEDRKRRAKVHQQFNAHANLWRRPLRTCIPHAREACRSGLETGDFNYAGYGAFTESWAALLTSQDLDRFVRDYSPTVALLERIRMASLAAAQELFLNWARALQGKTSAPRSLSREGFDERAYVSEYASNPFCMTFYYAAKLHLGVLFEEFSEALEAARTARQEAWTPRGTIWPVFVDFWGGLAMAALYPGVPEADRLLFRPQILAARDSLRVLAENCPENFLCFALVLGAEVERIDAHTVESLDLYEEAIRYARQTESVQHEALANERCAKLWLGGGRDVIASVYLNEAHRCYSAWGAAAKVRDLEARYGRLLRKDAPSRPPDSAAPLAGLDVATAIKATHAIAEEIEIEKLLKTLLRIAIENAGAERGLLIEERGDRLFVVAEGSAGGEATVVVPEAPVASRSDLPQTIVHLAHRTRESVLVGHAAKDLRWIADPYVREASPKSILCVPIVHQGRGKGLVYLENNLAPEAFTRDRIEMMQVLSGQAAIALENARLYGDMRHEVERRRGAEGALRETLSELQALKNRLEAENVYLQEEIRTQHNFEEIVGNSPALLESLRRVERVAPTDSTVLILGETGTGKELFARAIHDRSGRRDRPLVKVNCAAIASGLVESELFGHVKGAFTGALQNRSGRFELADGGTIFLDEVSELSLETQVKLLRVLQEQEFEPVGSSRTLRVDVRVIAASNRRLEEDVRSGRFRADLLYRLNVFPLAVPALRDRRSDIPLLASFFVSRAAKKVGKLIEGLSRRSMDRLVSYAWPGNVRELQNVIERAAILATGPLLELEGDLRAASPPASNSSATLEDVEREHILTVLKDTGGVVEGPQGAAGILGLHPNTLRSRMKKLGIGRVSRGAS
jgi:predicted ATPase/transcriptional regulator with GAF, ATPase, and Fis domain